MSDLAGLFAAHPRLQAVIGMVLDCLDRGLEPRWNAFNPVSQRLAERLGFEYVGMCGILMLAGEERLQPDGA